MGITNNIPPSRLIQPGVIDNAAARPSSPFEGQCIFQKDTDQLLVWNGTAWVIPNQTTQNPEGLELVKVQTIGTAVSSVTVSDAFSATYDNYLITLSGGSATGTDGLYMQLGATVTGYKYTMVYSVYTGGAANTGNANANGWYYTGASSNPSSSAYITLQNPFLTQNTFMQSSAATATFAGLSTGILPNTTSYTAFNLGPLAGTLTGGTVAVYGYRK